MNTMKYILLQLELECIGTDEQGGLVRIEGPNPDDIHLFFVVQTRNGFAAFWRADVEQRTKELVSSRGYQQAFFDPSTFRKLLNAREVWQGSTYMFPPTFDVETRGVVQEGNLFTIRIEGELACRAWSSRQNDHAAELAVETKPLFRRRGYAMMTSAAWAMVQLRAGRVPFYSHMAENLASKGLAMRLGVEHLFNCVSYS